MPVPSDTDCHWPFTKRRKSCSFSYWGSPGGFRRVIAKTWAYPLRHRLISTRSITSSLEGSSNLRFSNGNSTLDVHACAKGVAVCGACVARDEEAEGAAAGRVEVCVTRVDAAGIGRVEAASVGAAGIGGVGAGVDAPEQAVDDPTTAAIISAGNAVLRRCCTILTSRS
jgi:hypothetical protein